MTCNKITLLIAKGNNIIPTLPSRVLPRGGSIIPETNVSYSAGWKGMELGHETKKKVQKGPLRRNEPLGLSVKTGTQR
jgi:hypothetical protein